jgi:uncharacterized protein (TIRG00374 family)
MSDGTEIEDGHDAEPSSDGSRGFPAIGELDYIGGLVRRALLIALVVIAISFVAPGLITDLLLVLSDADRLGTIRPLWFVLMVVMEVLSFLCIWWLTRIVLPKVSWFVAGTSQLTANSVSRIVPGGAAVGGATLYRMLAVSGVNPTQAGGALAATSVLSTGALVAIPAIGGTIALFGAPIPEDMAPVAVASAVLFALLVLVGVLAMRWTRPLELVGRLADKIARTVSSVLPNRSWTVEPADLVKERDRLIEVAGSRWPQAMAASALNWMFDYLVLVAALYAVDADPRLSLVMIAYAAGAVLGMIPITPGGFGFVEVGLFFFLVLSGISAQDATVATLAYRVVSFWLPLASGPFAWLAFRRRYPRRTA